MRFHNDSLPVNAANQVGVRQIDSTTSLHGQQNQQTLPSTSQPTALHCAQASDVGKTSATTTGCRRQQLIPIWPEGYIAEFAKQQQKQ